MGYRLSKISTKTGDKGTTGLGDGTRVPKDHARIESVGEIDELNSTLGVLATYPLPKLIERCLLEIQHDLFDLGGELSIPGFSLLKEARLEPIENMVEEFSQELSPLKEFILPGGTRAAAICHVARTVCRRAERRLVTLNAEEPVGETALKYVNRLSDLLFLMARKLNQSAGTPDVLWQRQRPPADSEDT